MSHFTTVETKIVDLEVLKKALSRLGCLCSLGKTRIEGFDGITTNVDIAVRIRGKNCIGFVKEGNSYNLVADWWQVNEDSSIKQEEFVAKLKQTYAYQKVLAEAKKQNWTKVKEEKMQDGTIKMVLTKY